MKFVQGFRIDEDRIKAKFDTYLAELHNRGNYQPNWSNSPITLDKEAGELKQQKTKASNVQDTSYSICIFRTN